jgi:ubiquinone/menaquinone biosynthesis C-methylase UbiE
MPKHDEIYANQAEQYDLLISKQPDVGELLQQIISFQGKDVVELGAGTGRLTTGLARHAKSVIALDAFASMLEVNAKKLKAGGLRNWSVATADHRSLPVKENAADVVVAGWSICYLASSNHPDWQDNLALIMQEITRILRPGGTVIILETMGTGTERPQPPEFLTAYYRALEEQYHFQYQWHRVDYTFDDLQQAEELTRFFFGEALAERVLAEQLVRLPECMGLWWKTID